ncbi:hypothetical protein ACFLRY_03245, partial [Bacteroidota bacterium]
LLTFLLVLPCSGYSQSKKKINKADTLNSVKRIMDTLDFLSNDKKKDIYGNNVEKSDALYDSIRRIAYKRRLTKVLYDLTFKYGGPTRNIIDDTIVKNVGSPYEEYINKYISRVEIIRIPPFTEDTSHNFENKLSLIGNDVHVLTKEYVIRNNLLFEKGEQVDPVVLFTTARLLRDLPYIDEATIQILPSKTSPDSVTVVVVTKDKFPYAVSPVIKSYNDMSFKLWTVNFLGLGHRLDGKVSFDGGREPKVKLDESKYVINNIRGTFISGLISFNKTEEDKRTWSLEFNRPLIVPTIKQSYGLNLSNVKSPTKILEPDSSISNINVIYNSGNMYYAKTYPLGPEKGSKIHPAYLSLSGMLTEVNYIEKPFMSADSNLGFRNKTSVYGAISVSKNNYYLANYYYSFGKTENIPYGYYLQFTGGYEFGNYYNRYYLGFETGTGNFINHLGYYNVRVQIGTYIKENTNTFNQGILNLEASLASKLYHLKKARIRNYIFTTYTLGFDRLPGETILLNSNQGLEGLGTNELRGQERFVAQIESVLFTPWMFYGFTFGIYTFFNVSTLVPDDASLIDAQYFTGLGFGIRIKNENLVFETLQLQLAYYPSTPPGASSFNFSSSGISEKSVNGFFVAKPSVFSFE